MDKQFEPSTSPVSPQPEQDVVALIKKMQQQLVSLEQKIDDLIQQSSERSSQERPFDSAQGRQYQKPFRPYGNSGRPGEGRRDSGPRERHFPPSGGRRFDRPQGDSRHGNSSRGNFSSGRNFDKPQSGENRGFGPRRKKF